MEIGLRLSRFGFVLQRRRARRDSVDDVPSSSSGQRYRPVIGRLGQVNTSSSSVSFLLVDHGNSSFQSR